MRLIVELRWETQQVSVLFHDPCSSWLQHSLYPWCFNPRHTACLVSIYCSFLKLGTVLMQSHSWTKRWKIFGNFWQQPGLTCEANMSGFGLGQLSDWVPSLPSLILQQYGPGLFMWLHQQWVDRPPKKDEPCHLWQHGCTLRSLC